MWRSRLDAYASVEQRRSSSSSCHLRFVPLAWGIWGMLVLAVWVLRQLPLWGAMLGSIAGALGVLVVDLPFRILRVTVPVLVPVL